jgi:hypothetical protein
MVAPPGIKNATDGACVFRNRKGRLGTLSDAKENVMARTGKPKLSDAIPKGAPKEVKTGHGPSPRDDAEQLREAGENARARDAEASIRDRMVNIGRANQQAGRQGS